MQTTEAKIEEATTDYYAHLRVTPQEFVEALAEAEQKRKGAPGTVPLGEAIHALDTEIPAEEIFAIVNAKREKLTGETETTTERKAQRIRRLFPVAVASLLLNVGLLLPKMHPVALPRGAISVSEMPEDTPMKVSLDALAHLNAGASPGEVPVYRDVNDSKSSEVALTNVWTLIKINGKLFVKGYLDTSVHSHGKASFLNQPCYLNPAHKPRSRFPLLETFSIRVSTIRSTRRSLELTFRDIRTILNPPCHRRLPIRKDNFG